MRSNYAILIDVYGSHFLTSPLKL